MTLCSNQKFCRRKCAENLSASHLVLPGPKVRSGHKVLSVGAYAELETADAKKTRQKVRDSSFFTFKICIDFFCQKGRLSCWSHFSDRGALPRRWTKIRFAYLICDAGAQNTRELSSTLQHLAHMIFAGHLVGELTEQSSGTIHQFVISSKSTLL